METKIFYRWFTSTRSTIGIVYYKNIFNEERCYISEIVGVSENQDIMYIVRCGGKFPVDEGKKITEENYKILKL